LVQRTFQAPPKRERISLLTMDFTNGNRAKENQKHVEMEKTCISQVLVFLFHKKHIIQSLGAIIDQKKGSLQNFAQKKDGGKSRQSRPFLSVSPLCKLLFHHPTMQMQFTRKK